VFATQLAPRGAATLAVRTAKSAVLRPFLAIAGIRMTEHVVASIGLGAILLDPQAVPDDAVALTTLLVSRLADQPIAPETAT
jgi:hypothetical protein